MKKTLTIISTIIFTLLAVNSIAKAEIKVVTSIKPIHSLVSYVMDGIGKPDIIVDGYNSPHNFSLKPSHAKMIEKANLIIWVGEDLETFLEKPLKTISKDAVNIEIMSLKEVKKLKFREKNIFEEHDDHGHDEHKEHGHNEHKEHGHKEKKHDDHGHGEYDPHVWLDPMNAKVFHDAYQYFENRFGIKVLGALTVNPDILPGAEQLSEIREVIEHEKVNCLFSEPQFNPAIIKSIVKDTKVKTGVLDPLGATVDKGKGMYAELLSNMYASFKGC